MFSVFDLYKRLLNYAKDKIKFAYFSMLFAALSSLCFMASFWFLYEMISSIFLGIKYSQSIIYSVIMLGFLIFGGILYFIAVLLSHKLGFYLETNLKKVGLQNLLNASFTFFDTHQSGKIRQSIDENAAKTHATISHLIPDSVIAILTPICMLIITFIVDIWLGFLMLFCIFFGFFAYSFMGLGKEFMDKYSIAMANMHAKSVDFVRGISVLKIFGSHLPKSLKESIENYSFYSYKHSQSCRVPFVSFLTCFHAFYLFAIVICAYFVSSINVYGKLGVKIMFFACIFGLLFGSFMKIMQAKRNNATAKKVLDNLENLMLEMKKGKVEYGNVDLMENYDIEFDNVCFSYKNKSILSNINATFKSGKTYAIVGSSGSGKSTIIKLISGFYPIKEGSIKIGGKNILQYSQNALCENISYVFSECNFFPISIYENMKLARKDASDDEINNSLKTARCDFIWDLKDGVNTIFGTKGVDFSAGQLQRLSIARAILKNSPIIILDEPTAWADTINEYGIYIALKKLLRNKTTIIITHRLSSIKGVDEILLIDNGKLLARGTHEELMKTSKEYKEMSKLYEMANNWSVK